MVCPCIHIGVYEFERSYVSPAPSFSFLRKQGQGKNALLFQLLIAALNITYECCVRYMLCVFSQVAGRTPLSISPQMA
jgi:hypothetical protein